MFDTNIKELIAIGASVSANCQTCVKYHIGKARCFQHRYSGWHTAAGYKAVCPEI